MSCDNLWQWHIISYITLTSDFKIENKPKIKQK